MSFSWFYFAASIVRPSGWWKWTADLRWIGNGICCLMVKSWRLRPALVTRSDWPVAVVFVVVSGSIQTHHGRGEVEIDFLPECWSGEFECCLRRFGRSSWLFVLNRRFSQYLSFVVSASCLLMWFKLNILKNSTN